MSTAAVETKTSLADEAKISELKDLGWNVIGADKEWFAHESSGELRSVGPASSVKALFTQVKLAAGEPDQSANGTGKTVKVKNGQPTLPGAENAVIQDMRAAILGYRATTMEILDLQKRQKEEKKIAMSLMHKFEDELQIDPETGFKYFQVEMVIAELEIETKEDLKTRTIKE